MTVDRVHRQVTRQMGGNHTDSELGPSRDREDNPESVVAPSRSHTQTFPMLVLKLDMLSSLIEGGTLSGAPLTVRGISLVHRSWFYPLQLALAEYVKTNIPDGMRQYICNPPSPTRTNALAYRHWHTKRYTRRHPTTQYLMKAVTSLASYFPTTKPMSRSTGP